MSVSQRIYLFLFCVCLVSGCYEDEVELTLNSDGSGTIEQKLVLSERFMVAVSEDRGSQDGPIPDKEELVKKIGLAIKITSVRQTELPDGGRVIELEGTFSSPEQFFLSEYCQEQIKLRIAPAGDDKAAIHCDMKLSSGGGPSLTQVYGLAKGLHIKRTVHLPAEIEKTSGHFEKAANTVSWATDLRNKEGLARTKAFIEGPDEGNGFVVFDTSRLKLTLPLKVTALPEKAVEKEKVQKESAGLAAKVTWVSVKKKMSTEDADLVETSDLELGVEISWDENCNPVGFGKPVLLNLSDDLNKDLVKDPAGYQSRVSPREQQNRKKELTIKAKTPSQNAKKLKQLEGSIEAITDVVKEKVVLQNIQELVGKETTGEPVLDKLNFKVKSIQGTKLEIEIDGGSKKITSITIFKDDGSKVKKGGGMGYGDKYTYNFREDISKLTKCELEVVVSETTVKVPFSLEEISLP